MRKRKRPEQLSWLEGLPGRDGRVTVVGTNRALIENHSGILEYGEERIRIRCAKRVIAVEGRGLALKEVRRDALIVVGAIDAVGFSHDSASD